MSPQQALIEAAKTGDTDSLRKILSGEGKHAFLYSSALQWAAENGHAECVRLLIPFSEPDDHDSVALVYAAMNGHAECVRLLIPVSDPKADDSNALRRAAENGQTECVRLLLPCSDTDAATKAAKAEGHTDAIDTMVSIMQSDELKSKHLKSARDRTRPML